MKFPISVLTFIFAGMFLFMSQPTFAKMGSDTPAQEQKFKKRSLKERIATRYLNKKLKKQLKRGEQRNHANSSDTVRWILIIAGILIAIALIQALGGLIGQILGIIILAIVIVFLLQLLGVI